MVQEIDNKKYIEAISANIVNARFEDLDKETVDLAKNRIIDVMGCVIGGANAPGNQALVDLVKGWGGKKEATIFVHGGKAPAHNVAMTNAIVARSFDFEVMSFVHEGRMIASHTAATTVMTALAMAEATGANGKELIMAMLLGDDLTARIIASWDWDFYQGFDGIGSVVPLGSTAIASRLLGLNARQARNAFGIVLNSIAGSIQNIWDGATTFKFNQGIPARDGIFAAELAKGGWTGVEDALLSRFGYFKLYAKACKNPDVLTKELGKIYYGERDFKPYPCGFPCHGPIDCGIALVNKQGVKAEDIAEVTLLLSSAAMKNYYAKPWAIRDFPHGDAIFSFRYALATALTRGSVRIEHYTEDNIRDPKVNALIGKIKLVERTEATRYASEVKLKMKDGRELSESVQLQKGHPLGNPLTKDEIVAKYLHQVEISKTISQKNAEKLLGKLDNLEQVTDIGEIARLAVKAK